MEVVLHAEGPGELHGQPGIGLAPGSAIPEDRLGAGHVLLRRLIAEVAVVGDVVFLEPLRPGGRRLVGSDLLSPKLVRQTIVPWRLSTERPLIVLLIDANGQPWKERERLLEQAADAGLRVAVGVAVKEFESWLLADGDNLGRRLGAGVSITSKPEELKPREAKALLTALLSQHVPDEDARLVRRDLAEKCDLQLLRHRARSFQRFRDSLRAALNG